MGQWASGQRCDNVSRAGANRIERVGTNNSGTNSGTKCWVKLFEGSTQAVEVES